MKIIVVGNGKVGFAVAEQLSKENHDLTVIDSSPNTLKNAEESLDVLTINGNGASLEIQRQANVQNSDLLIAVTNLDEVNLLCCVLAKKLGCKHTIARVRNPEYAEQVEFLRSDIGLSMVINPERSAAEEIYKILQYPSFIKRESFAKGRAELVELKIEKDSPLNGIALNKMQSIVGVSSLICIVERDGETIIPGGSFVLQENDKITVTAAANDLTTIIKKLDIGHSKIKTTMIIGGGKISTYLANLLIMSGVDVKIIENNPKKCIELSEKMPSAIIINADGSAQKTLLSEGIQTTDALVALTGMDEENLLISMFANEVGKAKTVTKVNRSEYEKMYSHWGIESTVNPKMISATQIVRYVRAMNNSKGGSVLAMKLISGTKAVALEFRISGDSKRTNIPFSKLNIKKGYLIGCINRQGKIIIPTGNDVIEVGDTVVAIASADTIISDFEEIFENEKQ